MSEQAGPAAEAALALRDRALAALDAGDLAAALDAAGRGLAVLEAAGLRGGPDEAAVLVALAEIQEAAGRPGEARVTIVAAIGLLGEAPPGDDPDALAMWCQAQERLAGLDRLAGDFGAAAGRLARVLDAAAAASGEGSRAVVSAANALGVVHKHAGEFAAAETAYTRAVAHPATFTVVYLADAASFLAFLPVLARLRTSAAGPAPADQPPRPPSRGSGSGRCWRTRRSCGCGR